MAEVCLAHPIRVCEDFIVGGALGAVGEGDESAVGPFQGRTLQGVSQFLAADPQGVAAAVLAQDQPAGGHTDVLRVDDLVGVAVL